MRTSRRQFIGGALGATALSALAKPAIAQKGPIRIACITSLVGGYSQFGENHARGMRLAADMINANGGVNGRQLEIIVRDDGLKPDIGVATARELAADGVRIFGGVLASGVALALSGIMPDLDSVFLNAASHGNNLTHEDFHPNYFRVTDYSAMRVGAGSHLMAQRYPDVRVWGSVAPDIEIGRSVMDTANFRLPEAYRKLHNANIELKETNWVKFGATDYRNEIARLMSQGVDGLIVGVGGADETTFLQQAGQLGLTRRLKAIYTSGSEFLPAIALKSHTPQNYWSGFHWYYGAYPDNPMTKQVLEAFRAKGYGQHPDGFVGMAHTVVLAIAAAMKKGAGETAKELVPALAGLSFDSVKGPITLRQEDHQAICDVNYALMGPSDTGDGWRVVDYARIDGTPFAGSPTPGAKLKFDSKVHALASMRAGNARFRNDQRMTALDERFAELKATGRIANIGGRSLAVVAEEKTKEDPDRVLVIEAGRAITRAEMLDTARRLGGALLSRGIAPGAAIAFQLPNWWEACVINLAAALFGFRLVPLLTIYRAAELGIILPACGIDAIFLPEWFRGFDFPGLIARLAHKPSRVFTLRGDPSAPNAFERLIESEAAGPAPAPPDDIKMILFTSGSTGRPKGVVHSHGAIDILIRRTAEFWQTGAEDRLFVPSPIGHIGGSLYAFEFPWITGCTAILADGWDPDEAVKAIDTQGATFMAGATPFLAGLLAAAERAGSNLPSLRRFICGGASVPPELVRRALGQFHAAVVSRAYGSSEVPLICPGIRHRDEAEERDDTDGECTADLQILSEQDQPSPEGEPGEIVVRAPQMLLGYLDPADDAASFTEDGFFRTGDLGRRVADRFLQITGRKKDIIIRKGENISPLEIENALARHPSVRQSAVVGVPDPDRGEIVVAFVVAVEGATFTLSDMTAHLDRVALAKQKYPERLHVVSSLPMNSVGKVQKTELRAVAMSASGGRG